MMDADAGWRRRARHARWRDQRDRGYGRGLRPFWILICLIDIPPVLGLKTTLSSIGLPGRISELFAHSA